MRYICQSTSNAECLFCVVCSVMTGRMLLHGRCTVNDMDEQALSGLDLQADSQSQQRVTCQFHSDIAAVCSPVCLHLTCVRVCVCACACVCACVQPCHCDTIVHTKCYLCLPGS